MNVTSNPSKGSPNEKAARSGEQNCVCEAASSFEVGCLLAWRNEGKGKEP